LSERNQNVFVRNSYSSIGF